MFTGLSLDQAPPYKAPLKFFLTAPIYASIGGIILFFSDNYITLSPNMIAIVHLLTLGFMLMMIFGALQQMLPVVAGAVIPKSLLVANSTYIFFNIGIAFFIFGFFFSNQIFYILSAIFLFFSISFFTLIALLQLAKVKNKSYIVKGIIISLLFLIIAFLFGIFLLYSHGTQLSSFHYDIAYLHYHYIFFGFIFILIASITFQVLPMFWVASSFSLKAQRFIIYIMTIVLILYPLFFQFGFYFELLSKIVLSGTILYFSYISLQKLTNRKRKLKDITVYFYNSSLIFLIFGTIYWLLLDIFHLLIAPLGILFGFGFIVTLMNGMLYKIVPFLTWFHLSSKGIFDIPTMRDMINSDYAQTQFYLHISSVILFLIGFLFEIDLVIKAGSLFFIASNLLFFGNLAKCVTIFVNKYTI